MLKQQLLLHSQPGINFVSPEHFQASSKATIFFSPPLTSLSHFIIIQGLAAERNSLGTLCALVRLAPACSLTCHMEVEGCLPLLATPPELHTSTGTPTAPELAFQLRAQVPRSTTIPGKCPQSKPAVSRPVLHLSFGQGWHAEGAGPGKFPGPAKGCPAAA